MASNVAVFRELLHEGRALKSAIVSYLEAWPRDDSGVALRWSDTSSDHRTTGRELVTQTRQWFNSTTLLVGPIILHDRTFLYQTLRQVEASIRKHQYRRPNTQPASLPVGSGAVPSISRVVSDIDVEGRLEIAKEDAVQGMNTAIDLIRSVPPIERQILVAPSQQQQQHGSTGVTFSPIRRSY